MNIVLAPAAILSTPTIACDPTSAEALAVAGELMQVLTTMDHAAAVAAPQIGSSLSMLAYRDKDRNPVVISNPTILACSGRQLGFEGCLSFPDQRFLVMRHQKVRIAANDIIGEPVKLSAHDWMARMFQHELDHLDGILVTERARKAVNR